LSLAAGCSYAAGATASFVGGAELRVPFAEGAGSACGAGSSDFSLAADVSDVEELEDSGSASSNCASKAAASAASFSKSRSIFKALAVFSSTFCGVGFLRFLFCRHFASYDSNLGSGTKYPHPRTRPVEQGSWRIPLYANSEVASIPLGLKPKLFFREPPLGGRR
jgi:hypothetical protein